MSEGWSEIFKNPVAAAGRAFADMPTTLGTAATDRPFILPIILGIVAIAVVTIIIFMIVQSRANKPAMLLKGPVDLYKPVPNQVVIDRPTVKSSMAATYTLSSFIRIDAVPDMRATGTALFTWPGVWKVGYNAAKEQLIWTFDQTPDTASMWAAPDPVVIPNVPLQRWTQITITFEGRSADFYVNGALAQSVSLINVPPSANTSVSIVPDGIMGQLAYVQLWSRRLTLNEVAANYADTSDSQGRPYLGPGFFAAIKGINIPNLFCPSGNCAGSSPTASASQTWEFPYA